MAFQWCERVRPPPFRYPAPVPPRRRCWEGVWVLRHIKVRICRVSRGDARQKSSRDLNPDLPHPGDCHNFGTRVVFRCVYLDPYTSPELCWSGRSHTAQSCWHLRCVQTRPAWSIAVDAQGCTRPAPGSKWLLCSQWRVKGKIFLLLWKTESGWVCHLSPAEGLRSSPGRVQALDRVREQQERLAVTGDHKDQCLCLQHGLLNHLEEASKSFTLTQHMWDTVRVSSANTSWEIQTRKPWASPALCVYSCVPRRCCRHEPSRVGPAAWHPHQLVPPCACSIRWPC